MTAHRSEQDTQLKTLRCEADERLYFVESGAHRRHGEAIAANLGQALAAQSSIAEPRKDDMSRLDAPDESLHAKTTDLDHRRQRMNSMLHALTHTELALAIKCRSFLEPLGDLQEHGVWAPRNCRRAISATHRSEHATAKNETSRWTLD